MPGDDRLKQELMQAEAYPWDVASVDFVETHISWVFLSGDRVIKLKRPVHYSFVDYSTLEKRRAACEEEVRLNRLLAGDIYLGVVAIIRDGDTVRVDGSGEPIEWATLMRRLDADHMLDVLLKNDAVPPDIADQLADRLIPFHLEVVAACTGDADQVHASAKQVLRDNLDELSPFRGNVLPASELDLVDDSMQIFIDVNDALLRSRVDDGWIREGHGDLRCEHVSVRDRGLDIFDCVEFNRDLRCADIASDLAFLLMDLHRLGAPQPTTGALLQRYESAGADIPVSLLRMYWIHRALVRSKVHCLRTQEASGPGLDVAHRKAVEYLHVAMSQAVTTRPAVIAMTGLSGTGKSTVARDVARALNAEVVASDAVRKELVEVVESAVDEYGKGIYTAEWTDATYRTLMERADELIGQDRIAVLDATFLDPVRQNQARTIAQQHHVPFIMIETVCDEDVVLERLRQRQATGTSPSDATEAIYRRQKAVRQAEPAAQRSDMISVDTTSDAPVSLDPVIEALIVAGVIRPHIRENGPLV